MAVLSVIFKAVDVSKQAFNGFINNLKQSEKAAEGFGSAIRRSVREIDADFAKLRNGSAVIGGAIALIGGNAIRTGIQMESFENTLKALEGSSVAASRSLEELTRISNLPGIDLRQAIRGRANLRSVGIESQLTNNLLIELSNQLAITGESHQLGNVTDALRDIAAEGTITDEKLDRITSAAPAVASALQNAFGTSVATNLRELNLTTTDFFEGLVEQLQKTARVSGGTANQLSNLTNAAFQANAVAGGILVPTFNRLAGAAAAATQGFIDLTDTQQRIVVWSGVAVGATAAIIAGATGIALALPSVIAGVKALGVALTFLATNPIGLAITAVGALGTLLLLHATRVDKATEAQKRLNEESAKFVDVLQSGSRSLITEDLEKRRASLEHIRTEINKASADLKAAQAELNKIGDTPKTTAEVDLRFDLQDDIESLSQRLRELRSQELRLSVETENAEKVLSQLEDKKPEIAVALKPDASEVDRTIDALEASAVIRIQALGLDEFDRARRLVNVESEFQARRLAEQIGGLTTRIGARGITPADRQQLVTQRNALQSQLDALPAIRVQRLGEIDTREQQRQVEQQRQINDERFRASEAIQRANMETEAQARRDLEKTTTLRRDSIRQAIGLIADEHHRRRAEIQTTAAFQIEDLTAQINAESTTADQRIELQRQIGLTRRRVIADLEALDAQRTAEETRREQERVKGFEATQRDIQQQRDRDAQAEREAIQRDEEAKRTERQLTQDAQDELNQLALTQIADRTDREIASAKLTTAVKLRAIDTEMQALETSEARRAILADQRLLIEQNLASQIAEIRAREAAQESQRQRSQVQPFVDLALDLPEAGISAFLRNADLERRAEQDIAEERAQTAQRIQDLKVSGARNAQQQIERIQRESAERIAQIEGRLADERVSLFEFVRDSFVASLASMVLEVAKQRLASKLVDLGTSAIFGSNQSTAGGGGGLSGGLLSAGGILSAIPGVNAVAPFLLAGGAAGQAFELFDNPTADRALHSVAFEVGRQAGAGQRPTVQSVSGGGLGNTAFIVTQKSISDMIRLTEMGLQSGLEAFDNRRNDRILFDSIRTATLQIDQNNVTSQNAQRTSQTPADTPPIVVSPPNVVVQISGDLEGLVKVQHRETDRLEKFGIL